MADPTDTDPGEPDLESMFEAWYQERVERDERKKNRSKQPSNFGEFLDRVADAVWERGEERMAQRRKDAEEGEEAPARGPGPSRLAQWWGGGQQEAS